MAFSFLDCWIIIQKAILEYYKWKCVCYHMETGGRDRRSRCGIQYRRCISRIERLLKKRKSKL